MQFVSLGDNLHEMSNSVYWGKDKKKFAENITRSAKLYKRAFQSRLLVWVAMFYDFSHAVMCLDVTVRIWRLDVLLYEGPAKSFGTGFG